MPQPQKEIENDNREVDLSNAHVQSYPEKPGDLSLYNDKFDARAAAFIRDGVGIEDDVRLRPLQNNDESALLESKSYENVVAPFYALSSTKASVLAFSDYFPDNPHNWEWRDDVSKAILPAQPGWAGTFGPVIDSATDLTTNTNRRK